MKFVIVIATLAVSCIAAPKPSDTSYVRPTSINPSALSESNPVDRTTSITDLNEVNKYKQETSKPFYPTVLPEEVHYRVSKRDHKPGHDSHPVAKPKVPEQPKKSAIPQPPKKSALKPQPSSSTKLPVPNRNRRNVQTPQQKDDVANDLHKPQTLPNVIHTDGTKDLQTTQPKTLVAHHENNAPAIALQKPQTLPAIIHEGGSNNVLKTPTYQHNNISVPLVAKHKHPEDSSKDNNSEDDSTEDSGEKKTDKKEESKRIVTPQDDNVQVEALSKPKPVNKHTLSSINHPHAFHPQPDHIKNNHPNSDEQKPVTIGEVQQKPNTNKVPAESATSTDEHPLIRPKPVPVAELFSRHHDN